MNNTDELKARSVELAERAFRLRDRSTDDETKQKLHGVGNELIIIDNLHRFYDAQNILEVGDMWTEDQRSLAHELSMSDHQLRSEQVMSFNEALKFIEHWIDVATANKSSETDPVTDQLRVSLETIHDTNDTARGKAAINSILSYVEDVLQYAHVNENAVNETSSPTVLSLRNVRDCLLVHRELLFDEKDLSEKFKDEGMKVERLGLARHQLDELYKATS
jgi:hypothetical protein